MKKSGTSLLDSVTGGALLHQGGEASIYLLNVGGAPYVLKWYNEGFSFDENVVERSHKVREPGLYRIEEWGNRDGTPYLIYDYIDGESSETLGRMPVAVALVALRQVAQTLAALRKQGVSHGDLSPANVIFAVDRNGGNADLGLRTVLIDCGIVGPGALAYAAPERFQGKIADEKSDLFSLGLLLYRWIAGEDLITADGYEQFAEQMASVQDLNISEKLYATGAFETPEGAQQLSALEPLWSGLLCANVSERVEDFDELDEILEIALDKVSHGEVALAGCVTQYIQSINRPESEKNAGQKVPDGLEKGLPFVVCKKNKWLKWAVLGVSGLILLLIVLLLTSGTMRFGIDATGDRLLKRSRNIEPSVESEKAPDLKVDSLLMELPVPSAE
ncbi:serine/threonine protein kinase [Fibrobacter succinogenes]|uniref:Serine/threonine protein kinase n=1 Tax=Fibrobacter succinogenes TaxID=833 RepID=A0A380RXP2_FIBSU|nr:protein kinase [Fibrobacter succinogenes]PWJ37792.1 serine/threonine protein kinase [Fibrobacter succinogenes subsp. elongatus]SUQ20039.1 Serine/threonine protein kinase [Fibrobacter succinogenes]